MLRGYLAEHSSLSIFRSEHLSTAVDGNIIIRKASGHGLGHLIAPYDDPERRDRVIRIGVELWEEDLWREIIKSTIDGHPDQVRLDNISGFERPACSQHAATTPKLLSWFREYNEPHPDKRVHPFNFLLSLQAKSVLQSAAEDPLAAAGRRSTERTLRPAAPYDKDALRAARLAFDRKTGHPIPMELLISLGRSLVRYHLHPEGKFWGGDYDQRGQLSRRHVFAEAIQPIGKETDDLEEREFVGSDDGVIEYDPSPEDRAKLAAVIKRAVKEFGLRLLAETAKVSHHGAIRIQRGQATPNRALIALGDAAQTLRTRRAAQKLTEATVLEKLGRRIDPSNLTKILGGSRHFSPRFRKRIGK
jgi:hypothetical protein